MIKAETLQFLQNLAKNNNREWFQKHKEQYILARENALQQTQLIIRQLAKTDDTISADLNPENCLMRVYRDIRFSKNKTPYKTNIGIGISGNGKNFNGPGYYIHIQPDSSFVGGGVWQPETGHLKAIRQEIDYNGSEFLEIVQSPSFIKFFGELSTEDQLKTAPKGYPADHELINFIRLKSFVVSRNFSDKELQNNNFADNVIETFEKMYPLIVFLRNAIA